MSAPDTIAAATAGPSGTGWIGTRSNNVSPRNDEERCASQAFVAKPARDASIDIDSVTPRRCGRVEVTMRNRSPSLMATTAFSAASRSWVLCADSARSLGFEPVVQFEGPMDSAMDEHVTEHVLAMLQEPLSNVARHAEADHVTVSLSGLRR